MEQELSIINNQLIRRRIKREIDILIKQNVTTYKDIIIEQNVETSYNNNCEYIIKVKNLNDKKYYNFTINDNYPFNPPKVNINDKSLHFYRKNINEHFKNALKKYTGITCFCCETILCNNNWSPQFTLNDVINNINYFRDANYQIIIRVVIDVIKRKYLIDDVNIVEWLY